MPYADEAQFRIADELLAPVDLVPALEKLKLAGFYLEFNWSKSQGLIVRDKNGAEQGKVLIYSNDKWLDELITLIREIALKLQ